MKKIITRSFFRRISIQHESVLLFLLLAFGSIGSRADSFLIKPASQSEPEFKLELDGKLIIPETQKIGFSNKVVFLIDLNGLPGESWEEIKNWIVEFEGKARLADGIDLVIIAGARARSWSGLKSVESIEAALKEGTIATQTDPAWRAYSEIIDALPDSTAGWTPLFLFSKATPIQQPDLSRYVSTLISYKLREKRFRLCVRGDALFSSSESNLWREALVATAGVHLGRSASPGEWMEEWKGRPAYWISFAEPVMPEGFLPYSIILRNSGLPEGRMELQSFLTSKSKTVPAIGQFEKLISARQSARQALETKDNVSLQKALEEGLALSSLDPTLLRMAADIYHKQGDYRTALQMLAKLRYSSPSSPDLYKSIGETYFSLGNWELSEENLLRSIILKPAQAGVLEQLSRVKENRSQLEDAINYQQKALQLEMKNAEGWARLGGLQEKNRQISRAYDSYDKALQLNPALPSIRLHLVEGLIARGEKDSAGEHLKVALPLPIADSAVLSQYGSMAEQSGLEEEALSFYREAAKRDETNINALIGLTSLLAKAGQTEEALRVADSALARQPEAASLHALKLDLLDRANRWFELRTASELASQKAGSNLDVISRVALIRDHSGDRAAPAYLAWADRLQELKKPSYEIQNILERGLVCAYRDADNDAIAPLTQRIHEQGGIVLGDSVESDNNQKGQNQIMIPGGIKAMTAAAKIAGEMTSQDFLAQLTYGLSQQTQGKYSKSQEQIQEGLRDYLKQVNALKKLGQVSGDQTLFKLDLKTKKDFERASRILDLVGWEIRRKQNRVLVELSANPDKANYQGLANAWGIDELAMKSRLEAGESYEFILKDDHAVLIGGEEFWWGNGDDKPAGGDNIAFFVDNLAATRLYAGLGRMEPEARLQILTSFKSRMLMEKMADRLLMYSDALAMEHGSLKLPGGEAASAAWENLAGIPPAKAPQFIQALLVRDEGKLISFYSKLSHLPPLPQRFFTQSARRLARYYQIYPFAEKESVDRHIYRHPSDSFTLLAGNLPLDSEGKILFPGGIKIWLVARGQSGDAGQVASLASKAARQSPPEAEDEVLLRLLTESYKVAGQEFQQVENFLAVSRINQHRLVPMGDMPALLLSQNYAKFKAFYPYFSALPALTTSDFQSFFAAAAHIEKVSDDKINAVLGQFESLIHWLVICNENGLLSDGDAAGLFGQYCRSYAAAKDGGDFAFATLTGLEGLFDHWEKRNIKVEEDPVLRAWAGSPHPASFEFSGQRFTVDRAEWKYNRMQKVLELQKITPISVLREIFQSAKSLEQAQGDAASTLGALEKSCGRLNEMKPEEIKKTPPDIRGFLNVSSLTDIQGRLKRIQKEISGGKITASKEIARQAHELLGELNPVLMTTFLGYLYAYFFSPSDLMVAENPNLARTHQFYEKKPANGHKNYWPETVIHAPIKNGGRMIAGNPAQLAIVAGELGLKQQEVGESTEGNYTTAHFAAGQLASLRAVPWSRLTDVAMRRIALQIRFGKEMVVEAAMHPNLVDQIVLASQRLVGASRRQELIRALRNHQATVALNALSSSDLFYLADVIRQMPGSFSESSPVRKSWQNLLNKVGDQEVIHFGGPHYQTHGCTHAHLLQLSPYEDYLDFLFPGPMAERLGEFILNLAEAADRCGLPVDAVAMLAEPAVQLLRSRAHLAHKDDWPAAVRSMNNFPLEELLPRLEKTP